MKVTLGALRSLLSISREHPGDLRANLRSPTPRAAVETFLDIYSNPGLTWEQLATLRDRTTCPSWSRACSTPTTRGGRSRSGASGIVVSNHGGRQVDGAIASLDALPAVRAAVGPDAAVVLDSGVRTGSDVVKAIALGADAVAIGRPYIYGLALAGRDGVRDVLANIVAELDLTMGLSGVGSVAEIGPDLLAASILTGARLRRTTTTVALVGPAVAVLPCVIGQGEGDGLEVVESDRDRGVGRGALTGRGRARPRPRPGSRPSSRSPSSARSWARWCPAFQIRARTVVGEVPVTWTRASSLSDPLPW